MPKNNQEYAGPVVRNSEMYVPFYDIAITDPIRAYKERVTFINVWLKGGRFSGKTYEFIDLCLELMYADPARSTVVVAATLQDHLDRGVRFFDKVLAIIGLSHEWKWEAKKTRPILKRVVNGYTQEVRFLSLNDLETAGFEPPVNEATGKVGYYGILWADEVAKKSDNSIDADFTYIERLKDAFTTAKNTFVRHLNPDHEYGKQNIFTFWSLNPWGGENPIVKEFHEFMLDDVDKLKTQGYNLGYKITKSSLNIYATTNYLVNNKLNEESLDAIEEMAKEDRALTMIYGVTGRVSNSTFGRYLDIQERLTRDGNIPTDMDFIPANLSMDVGEVSAMYINGFDNRYMVKDLEGNYYPTRVITTGEWYNDERDDLRPKEDIYKDALMHIYQLSKRWPEMKDGITLYVDGSAKDTVGWLGSLAKEIWHENKAFDVIDWLDIQPQNKKWESKENRENREDRYKEMVNAYGLITNYAECPHYFYDMHKIVSKQTMDKFDHCWDAQMYGIMSLYKYLYAGWDIRAFQNKRKVIKKEEQ